MVVRDKGSKPFAFNSINYNKLSRYLIETYIVEKLIMRPSTCANIVPKFEVFPSYYQVLLNFHHFGVTFVPLHLLGSATPLSSRSFLDLCYLLATVCEAQPRLCVTLLHASCVTVLHIAVFLVCSDFHQAVLWEVSLGSLRLQRQIEVVKWKANFLLNGHDNIQ